MKHSLSALLLTACILLMGLSLPFACAFLQDHLAASHWPSSEPDRHYAYQGTFLNRVLALDAHLNASPAVREIQRSTAESPADHWEALSAFLPLSGELAGYSESFTLTPAQYNADYHYTEISYRGESLSMNITIDSETALPLRIELNAPPESISSYLKEVSLWEILRRYAAHLDLGELSDSTYSASTLLQSESANIRGTSLSLSSAALPSAGTILLKLTGSTSG